jgi:micrococcal nuclease
MNKIPEVIVGFILCIAILAVSCNALPELPNSSILPSSLAGSSGGTISDMPVDSFTAVPTPYQEIPTTSISPITKPTQNPIQNPIPIPSTSNSISNNQYTLALVTRIIDGDTIEVNLSGKLYSVRYIGMDTPETVDPNRPVQPFGLEASAKNKELVSNKTVKLVKDISETDKYGRLLRYIYVGDLFINAELVRLGYAQVATYPPDVEYQDLFIQLQKEAREAGRGLWGATVSQPTNPSSTQTTITGVVVDSTPGALSLQIVSVTSPVEAGATATLVAKAVPGAQCKITVNYKSGPSSASGLGPKVADSNGNVSWSWTVGVNTTPGTWQIVVESGLNGETASQTTTFAVQ